MTGSDDRQIALCVNSGSSSVKFAVIEIATGVERALATGAVERIGLPEGKAWLRLASGDAGVAPPQPARDERAAFADHKLALDAVFRLLDGAKLPPATVAGHRVVHGGPRLTEPAVVDGGLLNALRDIVPLAPLHLPASIAGIEAVAARRPDLLQVACFDTAFHASMPEVARRFPLPWDLYAQGVHRYGFHGLSYEYLMSTLGKPPPARVVLAHLGNGASLVAVKDGKSVDTTMGFTPAGGVMMGTRPGDLDPGVVVYWARDKGLSADALEHLVDHESGLLAVGGTSDMQALLERSASDPRAELAVSMFAYAVRKAIGALCAALGGVDLLVFAGGIGEHAHQVRTKACTGLEAIGVVLDDGRNVRGETVISSSSSRCEVRVVETREELVIARHAAALARAR